MAERGRSRPGGGGVRLGEIVAGVHRSLHTAPDRRFDRGDLYHQRHVDELSSGLIDHGELPRFGREVESTDVSAAGLKLDLEDGAAGESADIAPLQGNGARGIGRDGELSPLELLDLAGDSVAVVENDDVGLGPRPCGPRCQSKEY